MPSCRRPGRRSCSRPWSAAGPARPGSRCRRSRWATSRRPSCWSRPGPQVSVGHVELLDAEAEVVRVLERRRLSSGLAPRPKYHASHGTTVEMHGTPAASQASETGLTVSGVEVASIRSTLSPLIRSLATCARALRVGLAVLVDDLDVVLLAADGQAVGERLPGEVEHVAVGLAEAGRRTGPRADEADLEGPAGRPPSADAAVPTSHAASSGADRARPNAAAGHPEQMPPVKVIRNGSCEPRAPRFLLGSPFGGRPGTSDSRVSTSSGANVRTARLS